MNNEAIKGESRYLRGNLAQALAEDSTHFDEAEVQLLKFHGSYQQEDRDARAARKAAGAEKAYQFMVRTRVPGGVLTAEQYLVHDELAGRFGNGTIRLTTRQGMQIHGVRKGDLRETIASINRSLLTTLAACGDVNRNVMTCPAPPASLAHEQIARYARRLAEHLAPRTGAYHEIWIDGEKQVEPESEPVYGATYLPRKFKIGIACPNDNCIDVLTQDLGFIAAVDNGALSGFTVTIGGGMGSTHGKVETYPRLASPLAFVRPDELVAVAEAIVTVQRDFGDRANRRHARMKYLVEERGVAWFREHVETRLDRCLEPPRLNAFDRADDHLGWHRQNDGAWYLGLYVENGRIADTAEVRLRSALRELASTLRPGLRITAQQNLLITDVDDEQRARVEELLREGRVAFETTELGLRRGAMACPALPLCGLAVAEAERALPALVVELERELDALGLDGESVSIRMTGCPNGCARPRMGDVGIVGRSLDCYDVFLGGDAPNTRMNALFARAVRGNHIATLLRPVFAAWRASREPGETLGDFVHRFGIERLAGAAVLA